jgi:hypothetical protein
MLTPSETAKVIVSSAPKIAEARKRKITRFQIAAISLCKISGREVLDIQFINNLISEMSALGWLMVQTASSRWAFVLRKSANSWIRLSEKYFIQ